MIFFASTNGAVLPVIVGGGNRKTFRVDRLDNAPARLEAVEPAILVRHEIDGVDIGSPGSSPVLAMCSARAAHSA